MIVDFMAEFSGFLNQNSFSVSESKIQNFLKLAGSGEGLDISDEKILLSALEVSLAENVQQASQMEPLFHEFIRHKEKIKAEAKKQRDLTEKAAKAQAEKKAQAETMRKKLKEMELERDAKRQSDSLEMGELDLQMQDLNRQKNARAEQIRNDEAKKEGKAAFSKKKAEQIRQDLGPACGADPNMAEMIRRMLDMDPAWASAGNPAETLAPLAVMAEQALRSGQMAQASAIMEIRKKMAAQGDKKKSLALAAKVRAGCADLEQQITKLQERRRQVELRQKKDETDLAESRKALDRMLREMAAEKAKREAAERALRTGSDSGLLVKERAASHRESFIGRHASQAMDPCVDECEEKSFKSLTNMEREAIYYYVRKNILSFKTRMTRNIRSGQKRKINIGNTVMDSVRTGGIPIKLAYDQPKRSKADLVLILDVSGSCKEASEMMLMFIGILKEVFPRGCKAYAFVNSLYGISGVYDAADMEEAVKRALEMIPRKGQYSNYFIPLKDLWENHRQDFRKDSTIIFIGDARNNRNDPGEYFFKNICRKAKRAYWLNTEQAGLWDTADSQAALYGRYAKMYETVNAAELLNFIREMR